ncbi:restriction endonuclease subunit S [Pseudomonas fluorescens]|uniref:restriction endonuclease subunit S n=1 Tax=Pseudomonas fluorescens TaxID=294 RepID=UPI0021D292BD|nr:restriction endonuclease subunit S [Pseudomonas fluorescens]UXV18987.1 restriction endonuclease subunit S [Pseudomonas fluorescens]
MSWLTAPLRKVAPPVAAQITLAPDEEVWQLSLDQIESETSEIVGKRYARAADAGASTFKFDTGNVLYSKLRPYLNKVVIPGEVGIATTELIPLRPNPKVLNPRFLAYYLRSPEFVNQASHRVAGAKMPRVAMDWFWEHEIPIPSPMEQSRIVEILDDANRVRGLCREADAKAARILPALYVKMFGDPATNPMGWVQKPLSKVIQSVDAGWSAASEGRRRKEDEHGVLKVSAVTGGLFRPDENKAVINFDGARTLITPKRGDLLFSRANTRELVAASCIVERDYENLFLPDKLWRVTPIPGEASGVFLKELFWQDEVRDKFRAASSGSSGSMLNISQDAMLRTIVPIPPFHLQERFEYLAWSIMDVLNRAKGASKGIDLIWTSLLQRAFSCKLTASWREAHMQELQSQMEQQAQILSLPMPKNLEALL